MPKTPTQLPETATVLYAFPNHTPEEVEKFLYVNPVELHGAAITTSNGRRTVGVFTSLPLARLAAATALDTFVQKYLTSVNFTASVQLQGTPRVPVKALLSLEVHSALWLFGELVRIGFVNNALELWISRLDFQQVLGIDYATYVVEPDVAELDLTDE